MKTKDIRRKFYVVVIISVLLIFAVLNFIFIDFMIMNNNIHKEKYKIYLYDTLKIRLQLYVDTIISEIEGFQFSVLDKVDERVEDSLNLVKRFITTDSLNDEELIESISKILNYNINQRIFLYYPEKNLYRRINPDGTISEQENMQYSDIEYLLENQFLKKFSYLAEQDIVVGVYFDNTWMEEKIKDMAIQFIANIRLEEAEYIWIDQILNYEGGKNFARQILYPPALKRESEYLSTDIVDLDGNYPYQIVLENISQTGQSYISYNFEETGEKFSYSKLYPPYNWVISTGVRIEKLEQGLQREQDVIMATFQAQIIKFITITIFTMLFLIFSILVLEKYYFRRFTEYTNTLQSNTKDYKNKISDLKLYSNIDTVTGLYNRKYMEDSLKKCFADARKNAKRYAVILCDIDFFKKVNDTYGHDAGDYILRGVSEIVKGCILEKDVVARYGGEEFLVIIDEENAKDIFQYAENLRKAVEEGIFRYDEQTIKVTMSFGASYFANKDKTYMDTVNRADRNLYVSKGNGRNRVTINEN